MNYFKKILILLFLLLGIYNNLYSFDFYKHRDKIYKIIFNKESVIYRKILIVVIKESEKYEINPNIIFSIIKIESDFNVNAVSDNNAHGLMQINLTYWEKKYNINKNSIKDINNNIKLGIRIFYEYYKLSGNNLNLTLHYYRNGFRRKYYYSDYHKKFYECLNMYNKFILGY